MKYANRICVVDGRRIPAAGGVRGPGGAVGLRVNREGSAADERSRYGGEPQRNAHV